MSKNLLHLFLSVCLLSYGSAGQAQSTSKYDQLVYVNAEWKNQTDADPAVKKQPAPPLQEQQLIRLHLQETEQLLRNRVRTNLSPAQQKNRLKNLDVLHQYWQAGSFPINTQHNNRQPYFIDDYNTYCAVGYLMKMSGADEMAKAIHTTQNFNYLADIQHPDLMNWVQNSGLTLDELALIQPGYPNDRPARVLEFHYNNTGTDVGEYIEFQQPVGFFGGTVNKVLFYNESGTLYKTVSLSQMQIVGNGGSVRAYTFPANENFADKGRFELIDSFTSSIRQSVAYNDTSVNTTTNWYSPIIERYSVGESELTPIGYSLSYCGHTFGAQNDITLQLLQATPQSVNPCLTLPVTLASFTYKVNNASVDLLWETVTEVNTAYFEIERSVNGIDFKAIGKMAATGNSNAVKRYSFTDNHPLYANHYRLKQVDKDGKSSYSKILFVKFVKANLLTIVQNPVKQLLQVQVNTIASNIGSLTIYDFSGRTVMKAIAKEGVQPIDVSNLAAGKYLVRLNAKDGQAYNQQFIKQ